MRMYKLFAWAIPALLLGACRPSSGGKDLALLPGGPAWGALFQQRAAEYRALCYQAYNLATLRLDALAQLPSALPKAIITDIDETVLDNSPYFVAQARAGKTYDDSSWIRWTAKEQCDTVPGAVQFLRHAKELGVTVFYVTNRFQPETAATLANLRKFNLPDVDSAHLFLSDGNSSKDSRRAFIANNYEVVLWIGDNLGDFSGIFSAKDRGQQVDSNKTRFGDRFIVLPNAMYGAWEDVLYKDRKEDRNVILNGELKM